MPDFSTPRSLAYGLRLSLMTSVEDCRELIEPHIKSDWEIYFAGVAWPAGQIKANVQFACSDDRELAYQLMQSADSVVSLDEEDRRAARFDTGRDERRNGTDRRLKSGERSERPNTGRREIHGEAG